MSQIVENDQVVIVNYTLKNDNGEVMESSDQAGPIAYLHGHNNIVPGLEKALEGRSAGDTFSVSLPPADAYGEHNGMEPQSVHRRELPKNFTPRAGASFAMRNSAGEAVPLFVVSVKGSRVQVDTNHPLAGKTLHFDIEVAGIRPPTGDELKHGHAHGVTGAHGHH